MDYYEMSERTSGFNDIHDIEAEMGFCSSCHDHVPCGCEPIDKLRSLLPKMKLDDNYPDRNLVAVCVKCGEGSTSTEILLNDGACWSCNTQLN